jgi:hypothetical protein
MDLFAESTQPAADTGVVTPAQAMSDDDAFSWLESLAAKQGAKPEELLTRPEDRAESAPAWATQMAADMPSSLEQPAAAQPEQTLESQGDLAWLQSIGSDLPVDESTIGEQPIEETLFTQPQMESIFDENPADHGAAAVTTMVGSASADEVADWLHQLDSDHALAPAPPAETGQQPAYTTEELPGWLKEEEPAELPSEELPDWLKVEVSEQPAVVEPVKADWHPEQPPVMVPEPVPAIETTSRSDAAIMDKVSSLLEEPAPAKPVKVSSVEKDFALYEISKLELERGNLTEATQGYRKLIKKGKMLEEIIIDLREAQYRHPVDVVIWQTLGDAYMRANRLQDALDAFTKAEELLR